MERLLAARLRQRTAVEMDQRAGEVLAVVLGVGRPWTPPARQRRAAAAQRLGQGPDGGRRRVRRMLRSVDVRPLGPRERRSDRPRRAERMGAGVRRQPGTDQEHHETPAGTPAGGHTQILRHPIGQAQHVRDGRQPADRGRHQLAAGVGRRTTHLRDPQRDPELELVQRRQRHGRRAFRQRRQTRGRRRGQDARHLQRLP